jgi:hypothetical protein
MALGVSLGAKLLLGMALGVSVSGGARLNGEGVFDRSWHIFSSVIPTGPFVTILSLVTNCTLIATPVTILYGLGGTIISTTLSEESVI